MSRYTRPQSIPGSPVAFFDAQQVAVLLGLDISTVYENAEAFGGFKVGQRWRFPANKLPGQADALPKKAVR